jgi:sarcosine oxidase
MGTAACRHLAGRGARVLGLEQFDIPHAWGSSHGQTRAWRTCYHEHPDYVPLLRRAGEQWRRLEADSGRTILETTGLLYTGRPDGELVGGTARAADEHGVPLERLDHAAIADRFDQFRLPDHFAGVFEADAGLLRSDEALVAHAELALREGAELRGQEPVTDWDATPSGVTVRTGRATYRADHLVVCAGGWTGPLLGDVGVELAVTRQVFGWVWPRRPERFGPDRFPVWAIEDGAGFLHYGFPLTEDGPGLKIAHHRPGPVTTADGIDRAVGRADEDDFRPVLRVHLPEADGPLLSLRTCMYTMTPDGHFVIDRHPRHGRVLVAAGFSGHGFKFASVVGEALADLATTGRTDLPVGFLGLDRFAR